jgi:mycofactocin system creatininase family protein
MAAMTAPPTTVEAVSASDPPNQVLVGDLGRTTWTEVAAAAATGSVLLMIPVGSCEQHGPHLPLDTDTVIATALARRAAARLDQERPVLVAPAVAVTASGEHQGFAGTLSIGTEVLNAVIIEMIRSANWADEVILVNGHGGNRAAVDAAVGQLRDEGHRVTCWWPSPPTQVGDHHIDRLDLHAGLIETSMIAALDPTMIRADRIQPGPETVDLDTMLSTGIAAVSSSGVIGDPTTADAVLGEALLGYFVEQLLAEISSSADVAES